METETYKGYTIEIMPDDCPENPWVAWDCEPPILVYHGGNQGYTNYGVLEQVPVIPPEALETHLVALCELADITVGTLFERVMGHESTAQDELCTAMDEEFNYRSEGAGQMDMLEALYNLLGIPAVAESISGSCQGNWGYVLAVATPEWVKKVGATGGDHDALCRSLRESIELYENWAYGNVYGYRIPDKDDDGEDNDDSLGSCWGFYGYDHEASGLMAAARDAIDTTLAARRAAPGDCARRGAGRRGAYRPFRVYPGGTR